MLFLPGEIATGHDCHDRVEPLRKHPANPVMVAEHPWEGPGVYYPCVLFDAEQGLFRMWYYTTVEVSAAGAAGGRLIDNAAVAGRRSFLCYAQSADGLVWEKPELGLHSFAGSDRNNILFADAGFLFGCATVVIDEDNPDARRRYKMLFYDNDGRGRDGVRTAVSADGLRWQVAAEFPVLPSQDTPGLWHDRQRGVFVAFLKDRVQNRRARMIAESADFRTWSAPRLQFVPDAGDRPTTQYYAQSAFCHRGHALGLLNRFEQATQKLDLELVYSPGGGDWRHFPSRPQVLAPGEAEAWDGGMVLNGMAEPVRVGDEWWYYYYGSPARHGSLAGTGAVGIARFQDGRLAGQEIEGEGWFTSLPFRCPGGRLALDARTDESLQVAVHGPGYGGPLPGFTREDCVPVRGDSARHAISWRERMDLDGLRGAFIRLAVHGRNACVYGASLQ